MGICLGVVLAGYAGFSGALILGCWGMCLWFSFTVWRCAGLVIVDELFLRSW